MLRLLSVLLLILTIGVGNVWGEEEVYKTAAFTTSNWNTGGTDYTSSSFYCTTNGFRVNITKANNNNKGWNYIKMGSKKQATIGTITTNDVIDEAITSVVLTIDEISASDINSIKLYTKTSTGSWSNAGTFDKSTGAKSVTLTAPAADLYYKIEVDCKKSSGNGTITITKVEYFHEATASGYNITYNCDEADSGCPSAASNQTALPNPLPDAPEKEGYTFDGWYTNSAKTTAAEAGATLSGDVILYAKWTAEVCHETTTIFYPRQGSRPSAGNYSYKGVVTKDNSTNTNNSNASSLNGQTFTSCNGTQISFSHSSGSYYNTIWNTSNAYDIRLYQNNPVTFTAPDGYIVKSVSKTIGSNTYSIVSDNDEDTYTYTKSGSGSESIKYFTVVIEETCTSLGSINWSIF